MKYIADNRYSGEIPVSLTTLLLTCEHGGNRVPAAFRYLFNNRGPVLQTHEAYDDGALAVARHLASTLRAPLFFAVKTRLLVDCNRSLTNRTLFSRFSKRLPVSLKQRLIDTLYLPYRQQIVDRARQELRGKRQLLHCAVHSFTPVFHGRIRKTGIGLLYDPASATEQHFARVLKKNLQQSLPGLCIRFNDPYRGTSDGLTAAIRKQFGPHRYAGMEIEINQRLLRNAPGRRSRISHALAAALKIALADQ
jgi:predicted N-formylglutamate amidohydrolase